MTEKKLKFRVKPGVTFGPAGKYKAGTVVELTAAEAQGFEDKLIPLGSPSAARDIDLKNELDMEIDDEMKLLPDTDDTEKESGDEFTIQAPEPAKPKTQRKRTTK